MSKKFTATFYRPLVR